MSNFGVYLDMLFGISVAKVLHCLLLSIHGCLCTIECSISFILKMQMLKGSLLRKFSCWLLLEYIIIHNSGHGLVLVVLILGLNVH